MGSSFSLFGEGSDDASKLNESIFKDAQKHIDLVNQRTQEMFETRYAKAYNELETIAKNRDDIWKRYVLSDDGLAQRCKQLHQLLKEVDESKSECDQAQMEFNKKGIVNAAGDNTAKRDLYGCADQSYKNQLKPKKCEEVGEPLLCTWLRTQVLKNLNLQDWFTPPDGKCLVLPDAEFNKNLMSGADFEKFSEMLAGKTS